MLFSGSMRYNLDPFQEYRDESLVQALVVVEIKPAIHDGIGWYIVDIFFMVCV